MIHIQSRIPLRIYTGIDQANGGGIQLGEIISYKISDKKFHTSKITEYMPFVDTFCSDLQRLYPSVNIHISLLSEGGRSIGLGSTSLTLWSIYIAVRLIHDPLLGEKLALYTGK
jgi:hypothetical protein